MPDTLERAIARFLPRPAPADDVVARVSAAAFRAMALERLRSAGVASVEDVRRHSQRLVSFSPEGERRNRELKQFLMQQLYNHPAIVEDRARSVEALSQLFTYYLDHPEAMPRYYAELVQQQPRYRVVCDYIAGMTDGFLLRQHHELLP